MHGPYVARVKIGTESLVLDAKDVAEGERIAERFYQHGCPAVLDGFCRAASFSVGLLLDAGQDAEVEIVGFVGSGPSAVESVARTERVRRDDSGRLRTTLGSRFGERHFVGV